ncbi:MAG: hypothetical protein KKE86_05110 [Planctomycetes bacterium]|nr:hypothetical protein [Planctomycetota bacterium]MBU4398698.1 hypothetical protein [Planctomycetota bacterium]MCG2682543.1 hypothetical protein [Planctomycetales bacterium]
MKDPIVAEVRKHRMEHAKRFNFDLALICEDLRKLESELGDRLVRPQPKRMRPTSGPTTGSENINKS